jgi:hypothetical protein
MPDNAVIVRVDFSSFRLRDLDEAARAADATRKAPGAVVACRLR